MKFSLFPPINISFLKVNVDLSDERIQNLQDSCQNFAWYESRLKYKKKDILVVHKKSGKVFKRYEHKNWRELKIFQVLFTKFL